ncbi:MAG: transposase [Terriglobia bacterium]
MPQVDIITGERRVRSWRLEEKQSILAAAFAPGAVVSHVARRANISTGQLYTWRKQLMKKKPVGENGFAQVVAVADRGPTALPSPLPGTAPAPFLPVAACELPAIEIEVRGSKVRIPATMPAVLAAAVIRALVRRR